MLRVTTSAEEGQGQVTLKLEGKLAGPWVEEFARCWSSTVEKWKQVVVELAGVTFIDSKGKCLLAKIHGQGAKLVGTGLMTKSIIEEISNCDAEHKQTTERAQGAKQTLVKMLIVLFVPMFIPLGHARAQDAKALKLTLQEAVQLALKQNPQIQIANLSLAQSVQDQNMARAGLLPQADFQTVDRAMRYNIYALFGSKFPGIAQHGGPFQFFQAGPNFGMPIFDLTLWRRLQSARQGIRASEAQETTVREQIALLVVSQYLGGMRAGAAVVAAKSRVDLAQALYDQASDLQKNGVGTGLDTLRANVELQNEKQRLIEAQTQEEIALYGLVRLLNLDPHQKVELADQSSFFQTPEFVASESIEQAFATRPEVKTLEARERVARLAIRAASESRLPSINFGGDWAYQGLSLASSIPSYTFQVAFDVPIITSGRIHAQMARSNLELKKVVQERSDLRDQIALEVKTGVAQLESARHEVEVANLGVKLAQEEVTQARDRFQAGVANNIEVITAQDALARANDNQIVALYGYNQSRADLAHAIGQTESLYAK
jgi:outer membrane protein TolC/ABC-type transporter Mla MlaB component